MAELTAKHSGQTVERVLADGERDRWFTPEEALDYGHDRRDHQLTLRSTGRRARSLDARPAPSARRGRRGRGRCARPSPCRTTRRTRRSGSTSCRDAARAASAPASACACSDGDVQTGRRHAPSRQRATMRSSAAGEPSAGRNGCAPPSRNSNSGAMPSRRPAHPAMFGTRPLRTRWSRVGTDRDEAHLRRSRRAPPPPPRRAIAPRSPRRAAASTTSACAPAAAVVVSTTRTSTARRAARADDRCFVRAAHRRRDREHEHAVVGVRGCSFTAASNSPGVGPDVVTSSCASSSASGMSPSCTDVPSIVSHIGTTAIAVRGDELGRQRGRAVGHDRDGHARSLRRADSRRLVHRRTSRTRRCTSNTSTPEQQTDARGSSVPDDRPAHAVDELARRAGADRGHGEARPDDDVEHREREDALLSVELGLQRAHARRERPRRGRAERTAPTNASPIVGREAEARDDRTERERRRAASRASRSSVGARLEQCSPTDRAHAEERDEHAELARRSRAARADEVDAEREQRAQPERDRDRRRHAPRARAGCANASRNRTCRSRRCRRRRRARRAGAGDELGRAARSSPPRRRTTRRRARTRARAAGRADRCPGSAATSANSAAPSGIVPYDEPSTNPFASGRSSSSTRSGIDASRAGRKTRLADLDQERPEVDPPQRAHERDERDHARARARPSSPSSCAGPSATRRAPRAVRRSRRAATATRGCRRPRSTNPTGPIHERHERERAHPVAERRHRLTDEQRAEPVRRQSTETLTPASDSTVGPSRSSCRPDRTAAAAAYDVHVAIRAGGALPSTRFAHIGATTHTPDERRRGAVACRGDRHERATARRRRRGRSGATARADDQAAEHHEGAGPGVPRAARRATARSRARPRRAGTATSCARRSRARRTTAAERRPVAPGEQRADRALARCR